MTEWQHLALRAAQRWSYAYLRACRLHARDRAAFKADDHLSPLPSGASYRERHRRWVAIRRVYYGSIRKRKRERRLFDDGDRMRNRSIDLAHAAGVSAEGWQDVFYGELVARGVNAPGGVQKRWERERAS